MGVGGFHSQIWKAAQHGRAVPSRPAWPPICCSCPVLGEHRLILPRQRPRSLPQELIPERPHPGRQMVHGLVRRGPGGSVRQGLQPGPDHRHLQLHCRSRLRLWACHRRRRCIKLHLRLLFLAHIHILKNNPIGNIL